MEQPQEVKRTDKQIFQALLSRLMDEVVFSETATSQEAIDICNDAMTVKKSYERLEYENRMLWEQNRMLQEQINRIMNNVNEMKQNKYVKKMLGQTRARKCLTEAEKLLDDNYECCEICDRSIKKAIGSMNAHRLTNVCLSVRMSKELSKKSTSYSLIKNDRKLGMAMFRNLEFISQEHKKRQKEYEETKE